jgi:hypothetical protein
MILSEEVEKEIIDSWKKKWDRYNKKKVFESEDEQLEAEFLDYSIYFFKFIDALAKDKHEKAQ